MDNGAYGSYPKRKTFKKRLGNRPNRMYKRVNPVNQYSYKKTRIGRLTKTNMTFVNCTYSDHIAIAPGNSVYQYASNGNAYINLTTILQNSPEFVSRQAQYSYYMIRGMAVAYTRQWIDPIAFGVNGVSTGFLANSYQQGIERLATNFYPNLSSTAVGQPTEDADSAWIVSPFIYGAQSHYQPFPKNFTTGTNSNGLGVWNACSQVGNLAGQLSIYNSGASATASTFGEIVIFHVMINVYISFCNNTGA
nr:MAG: capsid protein [Cressdnaviricota sp.]